MFHHRSTLVAALVAATAVAASAGAQTAALATATTSPRPAADSAARPAAPTPPAPAPAEPPLLAQVQANAFISFGYTGNLNRPTDRLNGFRVFDSESGTFSLDVAELVLQKSVDKPGETGFRVDLEVGGAIPEKTQSVGLTVGKSADLQQAMLTYIAPVGRGLRLDFGKFVTHMGAEVIEGYDGYNDNYSRSLLFNYAIPFTHMGVKGTYAPSQSASATLLVVNGWDVAQDNNSGKSIGAQLALVPVAPLSLVLNYIGGPEKADTNGSIRSVYDVVATWKVIPRLTLGVNGDYGMETHASLAEPGRTAVWKGLAAIARLDATSRFALAVRGETLHDLGGTRFGTGTSATIAEVTVTPTYRLSDHFIARGDVRVDRASQPLFFPRGRAASDRQATVAGNVILVY